LGYGDVVLDRQWRLFGAIEGANGLLLFGWSTAFLFDIIRRLRTLEEGWLERSDGEADIAVIHEADENGGHCARHSSAS
jgi:hypothetical protein